MKMRKANSIRLKRSFALPARSLKYIRRNTRDHAREIASALTSDGEFAHLIAMGGDGTLHEVLNGIKNVENCTLGLIPLGSGNDFAESAGGPLDGKSAAETNVFRAPVAIDGSTFGR